MADKAATAGDDAPMKALQALRKHLIEGKSVEVAGDELVVKDADGAELQRLPKHAPTAYHSKKLDKRYDLLAVYTCFKHADLSFGVYVTKCREEKATMVSTVDKKDLLAYLKGDIETSPQILDAAGKPTAVPASSSEKHSVSSRHESSADKVAASGERRAEARKSSSSSKPTSRDAETEARAAKKRKLEGGAREPRHHSERHREKDGSKRSDGHKSAADSAADATMKRVVEKEYATRSRTSVLDAHKTTFKSVLKTLELVNAEAKEKIEKASKSSLLAPTNARKEQLPLHRLVKEKILGTPIIVVPAGFSDLFTMLNAKDFLEDGVYISNMQKKSEGCRKPQSMMITHEEDGHVYTFKVVDTVSRFRDKDWRAVVGVIVSGQSWQFKGWKWKFPLEVFKKVCGVHVYNQGSQMNPEIKQWDVKVLMIHPDKRHLDKVAAKEFWRYLFAFIKLKLQ